MLVRVRVVHRALSYQDEEGFLLNYWRLLFALLYLEWPPSSLLSLHITCWCEHHLVHCAPSVWRLACIICEIRTNIPVGGPHCVACFCSITTDEVGNSGPWSDQSRPINCISDFIIMKLSEASKENNKEEQIFLSFLLTLQLRFPGFLSINNNHWAAGISTGAEAEFCCLNVRPEVVNQ